MLLRNRMWQCWFDALSIRPSTVSYNVLFIPISTSFSRLTPALTEAASGTQSMIRSWLRGLRSNALLGDALKPIPCHLLLPSALALHACLHSLPSSPLRLAFLRHTPFPPQAASPSLSPRLLRFAPSVPPLISREPRPG